jgi:TonB family protein
MNNLLSLLAAPNLYYLRAQLVLLPLTLAYLLLRRRGMALQHRLWLHDSLLVLSLALPAVMLLIGLLPRLRLANSILMPAIAVTATAGQGLAAPGVLPWYCAAGVVGLLGVAWFVVQLVGQYALERRLVSGSRYRRVAGRVSLVMSDDVPTPFSTGLLKHRVFLPGRLSKDPAAMAAILRHETTHIRKGHTLLAFLEMLQRSFFWWNPLAHVLKSDGALLREHVCDEAAVKLHPVSGYCKVLMAEAALLLQSRQLLVANTLGKHSLRRRVLYLMGSRIKATTRLAVAATVVATAFTAALLIAVGCGKDSEVVSTPTGAVTEPQEARPPTFAQKGELAGGRSKESIMAVVMTNLRSLRKMYNTCLRDPKTAGMAGQVVVKFAIDEHGKVIASSVLPSVNPGTGNAAFDKSIADAVATWQFGVISKPGDITEVVYPFVFSQ